MDDINLIVGAVITVGVGRCFLLRGKTTWQGFACGPEKGLAWWFAALSIFASLTGGFMVFGLTQVGMEGGLTGYILGAAYLFGMPLLILAVRQSRRYLGLKEGIFGIDEVFRAKYGVGTLRAFYVLSGILFAGVLAGQIVATTYYLHVFTGIASNTIVLGIGCLGTVAYTIAYGFRGVVANDIIQGVLILSVSVIVPMAVLGTGMGANGTSVIWEPLSEPLGGKYGPAYPLLAFAFLLPSFLVRADLWNRIRLVSPAKQKYTIALAAVMVTWFFWTMTSVGLIIKENVSAFPALLGCKPAYLVPTIVKTMVSGTVLKSLCLGGILFALLSSIDSYLNLVALALTRLMLGRDMPTKEDEKVAFQQTLIANARVNTVAVALLAFILAALIPDIVDLLSASFAAIGVLLPLGLFALRSTKKLPDYVGWVPITAALLALIVAFPLVRKNAFIFSIAAGLVVFTVCFVKSRRDERRTGAP